MNNYTGLLIIVCLSLLVTSAFRKGSGKISRQKLYIVGILAGAIAFLSWLVN